MTADERARTLADIHASLTNIRARQERIKAKEPERIRLKIETRMAIERLHRANVALRAALPR
jgi:hypothetical protein